MSNPITTITTTLTLEDSIARRLVDDIETATEEKMASEIANNYPIKFIPELQQFAVFNGRIWAITAEKVPTILQEACSSIQSAIHNYATISNSKSSNRMHSYARSFARSTSLTSLSTSLSRNPKAKTSINLFNANTDLITILNGTYSISSRTLKPHNPTDLISSLIPVTYDPANPAPAPFFTSSLSLQIPDTATRNFLLAYIGQGLTRKSGSQRRAMVFLTGKASNGKSGFISAITNALGKDISTKTSVGVVVQSGKTEENPDKATPALELLRDKSIAFMSEAGAGFLGNKFKEVSGGDTIYSRAMYGDGSAFNNTVSVLMDTNIVPPANEADPAVIERVKIVRFDATFVAANDSRLGKHGYYPRIADIDIKLKAEADGIFATIINAYNDLEGGELLESKQMLDHKEAYVNSNAPFQQFLGERVEEVPEGVLVANRPSSDNILEAYKAWLVAENIASNTYPQNRNGVKAELSRWGEGHEASKNSKGTGYEFLRLKEVKVVKAED